MNSMRPASFFGSTAFRGVMIACGVLFIFLVGFGIGMKVGFHKALFSAKWGEQYEKNFWIDQREVCARTVRVHRFERSLKICV